MRIFYLFLLTLLPALAAAQVPFKRSSDIVNLSSLPYTPAVLADWDGNADPGAADDAVDQLAERVDDIEVAGGVGYTPADTNDWPGADPTTVSGALDTLADRVAALETAAAKGRLLTVTVGAEALNVIAVTIAIDDLLGVDAAGANRIQVRLFEDVHFLTAANPGMFSLADGGDGNVEANNMAGASSAICLSGGSARVQLNLTDVGGASGTTLYGYVDVLGSSAVTSARQRFSVTFDGV